MQENLKIKDRFHLTSSPQPHENNRDDNGRLSIVSSGVGWRVPAQGDRGRCAKEHKPENRLQWSPLPLQQYGLWESYWGLRHGGSWRTINLLFIEDHLEKLQRQLAKCEAGYRLLRSFWLSHAWAGVDTVPQRGKDK